MNDREYVAVERYRELIAVRVALWDRIQDGEDGEAWQSGGLRVIWSVASELDGRLWLHVSVSRADRHPSYADMRRVKDLFIGEERVAYSVWARASEHVNIHAHAFHLWAPLEGDDPLPDFTRGGRSI